MLTPAQIGHYHTFGFVVLRRYFTPGEVANLQREARTELELQYRHMPFDGRRRHFCCMNDDQRVPTYARLLEDPRFFDVAEQLVGKALPVFCDANRYVGDTGWHADVFQGQEWSMRLPAVKFCHYLEPVRAESGALRVIPGSHRQPLHDAVRNFIEHHPPHSVEAIDGAVACATDPGDVIAFSVPLWHASKGGSAGRGMCTIAYFPHPETAVDQRAMQASLRDQWVPPTRSSMDWHGDVFAKAWLSRAATDPSRRRVVERMQAAGIIEALGADAEAAQAALDAAARRPSR